MNARNALYKSGLLLLLAGLLFFACCKKPANQNLTINYQYNYYPIDSGHYIIYNVDSVTFNYDGEFYHHDTTHYQMMVVFGDTIHDLMDSVNFLLSYYTRPDSTSSWNGPYITKGLRVTSNLQVVENDIRFIKLVFPPSLNQGWNGNIYVPTTGAYSTFLNWNYYYENIDTAMVLNGLSYNHAIVASEVNSVNILNKEVRTEIYAQNVGMIYQEWESLSKQNGSIVGDINRGWDTGAESGFSLHMWAIAHYP